MKEAYQKTTNNIKHLVDSLTHKYKSLAYIYKQTSPRISNIKKTDRNVKRDAVE